MPIECTPCDELQTQKIEFVHTYVLSDIEVAPTEQATIGVVQNDIKHLKAVVYGEIGILAPILILMVWKWLKER